MRSPRYPALICLGTFVIALYFMIKTSVFQSFARSQHGALRSFRSDLGKGINTDEAAALGAVYQAAHHSPGFRVKPFIVKDSTYFPIKVDFERLKAGEKDKKMVTRTLFGLGKPYPHKMSITFNKHTEDFGFLVGYGALNHLQPEEAK